ncbi:RagB/SusD family nutrient uptake outer membrane protein [Bacteroides sp. BFG-551]|nr:RagB/SusD family nutrient uptake outer membrane protein [Bacteroides sp. BFG-551]
MNTAVIGCYGGMHNPLNIEWALTELRSDNTRMNSTRSSNDAFMQLLALDLGTMDASNPNIRTYWEATYQNINNCNSILVPEVLNVVEDEKKRAQFEGEALFIRAYHYFNLGASFRSHLSSDGRDQYGRIIKKRPQFGTGYLLTNHRRPETFCHGLAGCYV